MRKLLILIAIVMLIYAVFQDDIYELWVDKTASRAYDFETLCQAIDEVDSQPFWRAKSIIVEGDIYLTPGQMVSAPEDVIVIFTDEVTSPIYPEWFGAERTE